jgi:hypothetical protein
MFLSEERGIAGSVSALQAMIFVGDRFEGRSFQPNQAMDER